MGREKKQIIVRGNPNRKKKKKEVEGGEVGKNHQATTQTGGTHMEPGQRAK